jgi:hypothetical protein
MIEQLYKIANILDKSGLYSYADIIDDLIIHLASANESRNRANPAIPSAHPKVTDNRDHFPLGSLTQARNALARVNQFKKRPEWWDGTLQELVNIVVKSVKRKYPSITVSIASTRPGRD